MRKIREEVRRMDNEDRFRRTHPYSLLRHFRIYAVLLILTILQQVFIRPQDIPALIGSLGINALYVLTVLFYFISDYTNRLCRIGENSFDVRSGIFLKRRYSIPNNKISSIMFYSNIISYLFNAESISVDTPGGFRKKYDFSAYFTRKKANELRSRIEGDMEPSFVFKSRIISIILMSAFWANPVTGIIFIVPVTTNISRIVGSDTAERLIRGSIDSQWRIIATWISPAAALLAAVILLCWAISMLNVFLRYVRFKSLRLGDYVVTSKGLIARTEIYTTVSSISSVSIDQSLFMKILKLKSCTVTLKSAGKRKGDRSLLFSADSYDKVQNGMTEITGIPNREDSVLRRAPRSVFAYIYLPLILIFVIVALIILSYFVRFLTSSIRLLLYIFMIIVIWWLMLRIFAYFHSRISLNDKCLIVCSFHRMTLKKQYIPFEMIQYAEITRTPFQKRSGKCSMNVSIYSEKRKSVRIKQLPMDAARELLMRENIKMIESR